MRRLTQRSRRLVLALLICAGLAVATAATASRHRLGPSAVAASAHEDGATTEAVRTRRFRYRYIYNSDEAAATVAANGWNLVDVASKWYADRVPAGAKALVWVGDYDNSTCAWEMPDQELRQKVSDMSADAKVAGFFFSDEPDPFACPNAPEQHRARSALIHTLAPRKFTVLVMDANSDAASLRQIPLWRGAADYVGLDPYPCRWSEPCDFGWIDAIVKAANKARLPYWGVVQAFQDSHWRWPTVAEERRMLKRWAASRASGYMTFAWKWDGNTLADRPDLLATFRRFNGTARAFAAASPALEVHYTYTGTTSVAFDWVGSARTIRYGRTKRYGRTIEAHPGTPTPFSSSGPFWEAPISRLKPGTTYHYSIAGGPDATFATAPRGRFRFDVEADVGDSASDHAVAPTQAAIAADRPAFVLVSGDLTYANDDGQSAVDRHFDDVMAWSRRAAYMPAWGNHEWDSSGDDLRNYKGRFAIPHAHASPGAPSKGCCGEDWGWFDAGGVRFISYPEPYDDAAWTAWGADAGRLMAAAQRDPKLHFIVTFGHRPAYSTGYHPGEGDLASILDAFGDRYSKYVLNLNGHSHDYERFREIHGVVHVTAAGGGAPLETPWRRTDSRTAYRAMHLEHVRVDVTPTSLHIAAVCGPATSADETSCRPGEVIDSVDIARRR